MLLLVCKALHNLAPSYLSDLLLTYTPSQTLRSSSTLSLVLLHTRLVYMGSQAFSYAAPYLWNLLPEDIRKSDYFQILFEDASF